MACNPNLSGFPYDWSCDFRGAFMSAGSYQSTLAPNIVESDVVWPPASDVASGKPTMEYVGHVQGNDPYDMFKLTVTCPPTSTGITDFYIDVGNNYPQTYPPIASNAVAGDPKLREHIDFRFQTPGQQTVLTYSFRANQAYDTHAIVVLLAKAAGGYKAFGHYAVSKMWTQWDVQVDSITASTDGGTNWATVQLGALPWVQPTTAKPKMNIYRFRYKINVQSGTAGYVKLGLRANTPYSGPFIGFSEEKYITGPDYLTIEVSPDVAGQINIRTIQKVCPVFVAPLFSNPTSQNLYTTTGTRVTDPTLVNDWYGI